MSALGQKQTSRQLEGMSLYPQKQTLPNGLVVLTAGKRSDFFPAEFLYAGLGLRPGSYYCSPTVCSCRRWPELVSTRVLLGQFLLSGNSWNLFFGFPLLILGLELLGNARFFLAEILIMVCRTPVPDHLRVSFVPSPAAPTSSPFGFLGGCPLTRNS